MVFVVYEYYICIVHLTFVGFMARRQDYFILLSHGKQVDRIEEEVFSPSASTTWLCHKQLMDSNLSSVRTTNKKSVTNSLDMAAAYITFECSLFL